MAHQWADLVAESTTTTGTGAYTVAGAIIAGSFRPFSAVCSVGDTFIYAVQGVDPTTGTPNGTGYEAGVGTYSGTNTITRTQIIESSNSNAAVSWAAGTRYIWIDDIASTRNTLQQYSGTSEPSAPVEGLIHFAKDFNGWEIPYSLGATNRSGALFPFYSGRPMFALTPPVSNLSPATLESLGASLSLGGAGSAILISNTSSYTRFARQGLSTGATASTVASLRDAGSPIFLRGTTTFDGARATFRFGLETVGNTNCRYFVGLLNQSSATAATFDPATALSLVGIGCTGTDTTNMKLYHNDSAGAAVALDLGTNYPAKTAQGAFVELVLWAESSASTVKYAIRRLDDLTITPTTGSLSSDIPAAGVQMNPHFTINNNATAASSVLAFGGLMMEVGI